MVRIRAKADINLQVRLRRMGRKDVFEMGCSKNMQVQAAWVQFHSVNVSLGSNAPYGHVLKEGKSTS